MEINFKNISSDAKQNQTSFTLNLLVKKLKQLKNE